MKKSVCGTGGSGVGREGKRQVSPSSGVLSP
jgi:hypothetical protein